MTSMSGLWTTDLMKPEHEINKFHAPVIIALFVMEIIESFLLFMAINSAWTSYKINKRSYSFLDFLKSISFIKKCFLVSGGMIFFFNTVYLVVEILPIYYDDNLCSLKFYVLGGLRFNICLGSVYVYYWVRQYRLNSSPVLRAVIPKWYYLLSKTSLAMTLIGFAIPIISIICKIFYKSNITSSVLYAKKKGNDCYSLDNKANLPVTFCLAVLVFTAQILYVFMFLKTLRFHQEANKIATCRSGKKLMETAKRCLLTTTLTIVTDCLNIIVVAVLPTLPVSYVSLVSQTDLMLNMMAMEFCSKNVSDFLDQFKKVFICGHCKQNYKTSSSDQTVATSA